MTPNELMPRWSRTGRQSSDGSHGSAARGSRRARRSSLHLCGPKAKQLDEALVGDERVGDGLAAADLERGDDAASELADETLAARQLALVERARRASAGASLRRRGG